MAKKKQETIEDILDRIMDDIEMIREKCVCNGDENYQPEEERTMIIMKILTLILMMRTKE
jgi:excinuclease UvrABC helicase subunit UvrB